VAAQTTFEEAQSIGLRYVSDAQPGIQRRRAGRGFTYRNAAGARVSPETLDRIRRLAIPPAWTDVWICPHERGYLQATGRDAKGRKQFIYHPEWSALRDDEKFGRMRQFGKALPRLRERVERDMRSPGLQKRKVLATIVRLLELSLIRIGNRRYAIENRSFGLTTLRNRHVRIESKAVQFRFKGKSGKFHEITLEDRRIANIVRKCQDLPGQELFEYLDDEGNPHSIDSSDVNAYLRDIAGEAFTAKDFRTWVATIEGIRLVRELRPQTKAAMNAIVKTIAGRLGNTPAVCRRSYIHPKVFEIDPEPLWITCLEREDETDGLSGIEAIAVQHFLI